MSRTQRTSASGRLARVAAVSAVALVGGGLIGAGPADAASATLNYNCTTILGAATFTSVLDTNAPATLPVGKTVSTITSAQVTVPGMAALLSGLLHVATFSGTATATGYTDGVAQEIDMVVPTTSVPTDGDMVVPSSGPSGTITGEHVGDVITLSAGDFSSTLDFYDADGNVVLGDQVIPCTLAPDQDATVDTVRVVKANSTTRATAHYKKGAKKAIVKAKVSGAYGNDPSGRVTFVVKKGKNTVAKTTRSLNGDNVAQATFGKSVRKPGGYTVTATYAGNGKLNGSTSKTTFRVTR
jgi:hypothetical protein